MRKEIYRLEAPTLFRFMHCYITRLEQMGKNRTAEHYQSALNSFRRFRQERDLFFHEITTELMQQYEAHLHHSGIVKNTISFYNRILRATYNRAVAQGYTPQHHPFRKVYTGIDKTAKRAVSLQAVHRIKQLDLSHNPQLTLARDLFLFSFYTRGMSFVDMSYLKKSNLQNGILTYRRRKTGQLLTVRWEPCMQDILDRYTIPGPYLLPILQPTGQDEYEQYKKRLRHINRKLKLIGQLVQLPLPLTLYVARHTWASAAKAKHIPLSVISQSMGHHSEQTTLIYLASLDTAVVDNANKMILDSLC